MGRHLNCFGFIVIFALTQCSQYSVLSQEPMVSDSVVSDAPKAPQDGAVGKLLELLHNLGYEGVGLKYESHSTIEFLSDIFNDPRTHNRQIALVYTGIAMSYDPTYQSLTVGGVGTIDSVIKFVEKNVPNKSQTSGSETKELTKGLPK